MVALIFGRAGAALAVGILALWASFNEGKKSSSKSRKKHLQAWALAVGLKFQSVENRDDFLKIWLPLAEYVREQEPDTLSFEFLVADTDPTKVMVYERYVSKDAFLSSHRKSGPFLAFKDAQARLPFPVEVTGQSYYETNHGFM